MSKPKLSILICHQPDRHERVKFLSRLKQIVWPQLQLYAEMRIHEGIGISIGQKRNELLQDAEGEYVCFIDDDDRVTDDYVERLMEGINKGVDCCSLKGIITEDGKNPKTFIHSIRYDSWYEKDGIYYRNPNHLNAVRASIAKQMKFPETNHGEDKSYSDQLKQSGLIKTEYWIEDTIYYYEYLSKK